jgi:hypothetical protein
MTRAMNANGYGWQPGELVAAHTDRPLVADGRASDPRWARAPRTPRFVDMATGLPAPLATTAAVIWTDTHLHIAFWAEEPTPTATLTQRDALIFFENDLEIFIDGGDAYYELEFNAAGTIYEVFFVWRDAAGPGTRWDQPKFDVHSPRVHSFGGDYDRGTSAFWTGNHPRGTRWAFLDHDMPGLDLKVHVDGRLNDPATLSRGWTAEVSIPWASLGDLANGRSLPPRDGDTWGILFARFEQIAMRSGTAAAGWCAHAFGVADTHIPESFTQVTFDRSVHV